MKLFFKHLINSIKKRPLQPFILIFTLILAVTVCASSISLGKRIGDEVSQRAIVRDGGADFTVKVSSSSKSRFMFAKDAENILGERANVSGVYELPLFIGQEKSTFFAVATDFYNANVFHLEFLEYQTINKSQINEVALVSKNFLDKNSLSIGDSFSSEVLGYQKTYKIVGVSENQFLASYDVFVNISGVMQLLAKDSLLVSSLGEDFKPCNTLYVNVLEGYNEQDCISLLKSNKEFIDKDFALVKLEDGDLSALGSLVYVFILLTLLLSATVVFCCFYIISSNRAQENLLFKNVGAEPYRLKVIQIAEVALYWIIGAPIGILLAIPFDNVVYNLVGFSFVQSGLNVVHGLLSGVLVLASSLFTVGVLSPLEIKKAQRKTFGKKSIYLILVFLILVVTLFFIPPEIKFIFFCLAVVLSILLILIVVPPLIRTITRKIDALMTRRALNGKRISVPFSYAIKNLNKIDVLQNSCRLLVVLITAISVVVLSLIGGTNVKELYKNEIVGDYVVMSATESCIEKIEQVDCVESVYSIYFGMARTKTREDEVFISASNRGAITDRISVGKMPKGNEVSIAITTARINGLSLGDKVTFNIGGRDAEVVVSEIRNDTLNVVLFDSDFFGIPNNLLTVRGKEGVSKQQLRSDLSVALALEMTAVIDIEDYSQNVINASELYLNSGYVLLPLMASFAAIGFIDNLSESYRSRREEFRLFRIAGMSRAQARKTKLYEMLLLFAFSIVLGLISTSIICVLMDQGLQALEYSFYYSLFG